MRIPLVYKPAPALGLDIGSRTVKAMQLGARGGGWKVAGFGYADFPSGAIVEGIIADPEALAQAVKPMLQKPQAGRLSAKRVVLALPTSKVFTRILRLPPMGSEDLAQAVRYETEQYVPVPINDVYLDFQVVGKVMEGEETQQEVLMVAAPRAIVDSYLKLVEQLELEVAAIETSLDSVSRAVLGNSKPAGATLVVDFGASAADITVFKHVIRLVSTIPVGGDNLTQGLAKGLGITGSEANEVKYKFGLGKSDLQPKITKVLTPLLQSVNREVTKIAKYYEQHGDGKQKVQNVVLTGGGANMPGLTEYMAADLKLPVSVGDAWSGLGGGLATKASGLERPMLTTAIGLAMRGARRD